MTFQEQAAELDCLEAVAIRLGRSDTQLSVSYRRLLPRQVQPEPAQPNSSPRSGCAFLRL